MIIEDIIKAARRDFLADVVEDYLVPDVALEDALNYAENDGSIRGELLKDNSTATDQAGLPLCSLSVSAGTSSYAISSKIIRIDDSDHPSLTSNNKPIYQVNESWLDEFYSYWRSETGEPTYFIQDKSRIIIVPTPDASYTIRIPVYRRPLYDKFRAPVLSIGSTATKVGISEFRYSIAGAVCSFVQDNDGVALGAATIPTGTWAIWKASVDSLQNITLTAGAANATTGYATEALAVAALPATPVGGHYFAYFTIFNSAGFIAGTTALNASGVTVNFYPRYFSPEIEEELHYPLIYGMCAQIHMKDDLESEQMTRSEKFDKKFTEVFGPRRDARLLAARRRRKWQKEARPKAFGIVGIGSTAYYEDGF